MSLNGSNKDKSETYALKVGDVGAQRLDVMDRLINLHSRQHLLLAGVDTGKTVIDIGCGNGALTTWIAEQVGEQGKVLGLDISEAQLEIAREKAIAAQLNNVDYRKANILEDAIDDIPKADVVHIRCVMMHVKEPLEILARAKAMLKPGGKIVCQEPITSSATSNPPYAIFTELNDALMKMGKHFGVNYDLGSRLGELVQVAGFEEVSINFSQSKAAVTPMKALLSKGIPECKPAALQAHAASEVQLDSWHNTITTWDEKDEAFEYLLPKQAHVIGVKR